MKFRLFGGLDCPDNVLAQLAIVASVSVPLVSSMSDHATTILLLRSSSRGGGHAEPPPPHGAEGSGPAAAADYDQVNAAFFAQSTVLQELSVWKAAEALTAVHTLLENLVRYGVPEDVAAQELSYLGLRSEVAEALLSSGIAFRKQLHRAFQRQTPTACGSLYYRAAERGDGDGSVVSRVLQGGGVASAAAEASTARVPARCLVVDEADAGLRRADGDAAMGGTHVAPYWRYKVATTLGEDGVLAVTSPHCTYHVTSDPSPRRRGEESGRPHGRHAGRTVEPVIVSRGVEWTFERDPGAPAGAGGGGPLAPTRAAAAAPALVLRIPEDKARALLAELVLARELLAEHNVYEAPAAA